jgi:hypothetical protein
LFDRAQASRLSTRTIPTRVLARGGRAVHAGISEIRAGTHVHSISRNIIGTALLGFAG